MTAVETKKADESSSLIKEIGIKRFADDASDVAWLDPEHDASARSLEER